MDQEFMRRVARVSKALHKVLEFEDAGSQVDLSALSSMLAAIAYVTATLRTLPEEEAAALPADTRLFCGVEAPVVLAKIGGLCTALATATTREEVEQLRRLYIDVEVSDNAQVREAPGSQRPS